MKESMPPLPRESPALDKVAHASQELCLFALI